MVFSKCSYLKFLGEAGELRFGVADKSSSQLIIYQQNLCRLFANCTWR